MGKAETVKTEQRRWQVPSLPEQVNTAERYGIDDLLYCDDPWAIRHQWINRETGEVQRARCNRWECAYCGTRKVDLWRQLIKAAEPVLFLTLTKAGKTVQEAARALTTFVQALRRGSKGKGPNRIGARPAYQIEYFAVLEQHKDFERNGFHWHVLIKGVDHVPYKEVIQPLWMSATHYKPSTEEEEGRGAKIARIERIRNARAIGYVTKYLMKGVGVGRKGVKQVQRERLAAVEDGQGNKRIEKQTVTEEVMSKAHRIRYSRSFFPERVADLRARLFAGLENETMEQASGEVVVEAVPADQSESSSSLEPEQVQEEEKKGSRWMLKEKEGFTNDIEEYRLRKRKALLSALKDLQGGNIHLSRRVIGIWAYQRSELRRAG
jgi:hypothetical protein